MSGKVYANGREVSAKKDSNKTMGAMPDICLSPPSPPAGPIPIPYPNFAKATDTSAGTKRVMIKGKEVGKKNSSNYKKSKGDMPATRNFGMGTVTHTLEGKMYHAAWSFNVKFEGENAIRHMDLTTHNHASTPPDSACTGMNAAGQATPPPDPECEELGKENADARNELAASTSDKSVVGPNGNGRGTTVASAKFTPAGGGAAKTWTAHSNQKAHAFRKRRFANGGKRSQRRKGKSNLCAAAKHSHAPPPMQKSGHSEARIFDEMFKGRSGRPGQITFNIDWRPKTGAPSKMPCEDCHKMMCAAKACGVQIFLCDKKGQKQEVSDQHCPANAKTYRKLQTAMGEGE